MRGFEMSIPKNVVSKSQKCRWIVDMTTTVSNSPIAIVISLEKLGMLLLHQAVKVSATHGFFPEATRRLDTIVRVTHHTVAAISIAGTSLDVLGSLYLAYDLLGGQHGPLRVLTRAVTYSLVFGIGYGLGLGVFFGFVAGIATGVTLAIEFNRAARGLDHYSLPWEGLFPAIRSFPVAVGLYSTVRLDFA